MENTSHSATPSPVESASLTQPVGRPANLGLALIAGLVAAIVCAGLWAGIAVLTERNFVYAAIGVGALVGVAIRKLGNGSAPAFGVLGALLSLFGCALGNLLTVVAFMSKASGAPFFESLGHVTPDVAIEMMKLTFQGTDLIFYGVAAFVGFKLSRVEQRAS